MPYQINAKHLTNVEKLPAAERYDYFIKRVADWQEAWSIEGDKGWLTGTDEAGVVHVPLWAHPMFAEMCTSGEWSKGKVVRITLRELLEKMLPQLDANNEMLFVMPVPTGAGISVQPMRLKEDLLSELQKIE